MKDNKKAEFINELKYTAIKYKDCQCLREMLKQVVIKHMGIDWWLSND